MGDGNYTRVHRAFLQACGRNGVLNVKQAQEILVTEQNKYENDGGTSDASAALRKIIDEINAKFNGKEVEQKLSMVYQEWGDPNNLQSEEFLVLCNTFATVGASPVYNETECTYLKNLIEKIVISETHTIPLMTAIYLSSQPATQSQSSQSTSKKITKQRAEDLLEEFAMSGYIFLTAGGSVTLGPRAIGEFRDVLRTKFGDYIQSCRLCNEIVLQPMYCPNDDCEAALDKRCFKSYVTKKKKCPGCKANWEDEEEA